MRAHLLAAYLVVAGFCRDRAKEALILVAMLGATALTMAQDIQTLVNQAQTDVTANIWPVALAALAIFAIMVGVALIFRLIRKSIAVR